ncbi:MAG: single-stranded-DNA-specific exonuclease RecJ [Myxococcota bacterium]|nr:single-stranded-DNA-specific exonuclease RecJ [Myxococcota bacterium]
MDVLATTERAWLARSVDGPVIEKLSSSCNISTATATLLYLRGLSTADEATQFLAASLSDMADPGLMADINRAALRLLSAIKNGEKIIIYGDYDVDGVTSTAVLWLFFRDVFGIQLGSYIPHRLREGYGLNADAIRTLAEDGTQVLVTVDNGSSANEEARLAKSLGMDVIVIDHHQVSDPEPDVYAHLNPHRQSCGYPYKGLAAVGVVFLLLVELRRALRVAKTPVKVNPRPDHYLDLVALGTVADVAPLTGLNRAIVRYGLTRMKAYCRPGIKAMLTQAGGDILGLSERDFGYKLGPRINAAGRLDDATRGLRLLISDDQDIVDPLARLVEEQNKERKHLQATMTDEALEMSERSENEAQSALVFASPEWHPGVVGIVASRLVETHGKPVILFAEDGGVLKGSARSIPGVDVKAALDLCSDKLMRYGGHVAAAGMTLKPSLFDEFRLAFCDAVDRVKTVSTGLKPVFYDFQLALKDFDRALLNDLMQVGPFGHGNQAPRILSTNVHAAHRILRGGHLKLLISTPAGPVDGLAWNRAADAHMLAGPVDLIFTPDIEVWQGREKVVFRIEAMRPGECAG